MSVQKICPLTADCVRSYLVKNVRSRSSDKSTNHDIDAQ